MRPGALIAGVLCAAAVLAGCGGSSSSEDTVDNGSALGPVIERNADNAGRPELVIGSKNFTEQYILASIYARALRAAGYRARTRLDLGDEQDAYGALRAGRVSAYPEYTGTALTAFYGRETADIPSGSRAAYEDVRDEASRDGLVALAPTPFSDSNGFAVTREVAREHHLRTLSDLEAAGPALTLSGPAECERRMDCLRGLQSVYGVEFKDFLPIDIADRYDDLTSGNSDVTVVFTTDGQIRTEGLVLLRDDRHMLPPYNVTLLVRKAAADGAGPDLERIVALVQKGLTTSAMQELNSRVDIDGQRPRDVAVQYLQEQGLIVG